MATLPSMDEILKEINRIKSEKIDGFTTRDMMDATGRCDNWCRQKIADLIRSGKAELSGKVRRPTIDGKTYLLPVYRIIDNDKS